MSIQDWIDLPENSSWKPPVDTASDLPATGNNIGDASVADDTQAIYVWSGTSWVKVASPGAATAIDALIGDGTATGPGVAVFTLVNVNSNTGSFGSATNVGNFTVNGKGLITSASNILIQIPESQVTNLVSDLAGKQPTGNYITALTGDVTAMGPGSVTATLATVNSDIGTFGSSSVSATFTVNAKGLITAASQNTITAPAGLLTGTTLASNVVNSSIILPTSQLSGFVSLTSQVSGVLPVVNGGTGTTTSTGTGSVVLSNSPSLTTPNLDTPSSLTLTNATGLPLATGVTGTLQATNFPSLTGDITTTAGSLVTTLATVNSNVGTFGDASDIPVITVNAKGLVTAVSTDQVIAPAGTLSGTVLNSTVVSSSLTSVGTITTGVWNGTVTSGVQFITSGTSYTTPAGITTKTLFKFTLIGGGGGGGGFSAAGECASGGGAGGGGILWITGLSPSTAYAITIGGAGSAGIATTPGNAGSGGSTTLIIGPTTYTAAGGIGSGGGATNSQGGAGGSATNFTINIKGQNGNGSAANNPASTGGGGNPPFGLGLGGASLGASSVGLTGTGYGAGGSGAHGSGLAGGAGTAGCILVEWQN